MFLGSCSNDCFNLHTPSAPELFSRTAPAATAAALTMGRFGILMPSETSLSRQLWAYSRRSSSASAWHFGNQTTTTCCYLQYRFSMPKIYIYIHIMWDWNLHHLWRNSRQNWFASSMLPSLLEYVGITSWKNQTCLAHGQVYSLPSCHSLRWQPPKHHNSASQKSDALDALD